MSDEIRNTSSVSSQLKARDCFSIYPPLWTGELVVMSDEIKNTSSVSSQLKGHKDFQYIPHYGSVSLLLCLMESKTHP